MVNESNEKDKNKTKSFRIEESLYKRMELFIESMAGKYSKSRVLSTAIFMYHEMYGDNPSVPDTHVAEDLATRDKDESKAAKWVYHNTKKGRVKENKTIVSEGIEINIPKGTSITYKPPHIIECSMFKGCKSQVFVYDADFETDEQDNIILFKG